ncbi:MAG: asparaginase domain-containing protein [Parcubacteria group bacterium]
MKPTRKKICLLFAGGSTLSAAQVKETTVSQKKDVKSWMARVPELEVLAEIDPVFIDEGKPADIIPAFWSRLARVIYEKIKHYDGFVVTHNIESVVYMAAVLSFMLRDLNKPVVFTSSLASPKYKSGEFKGYEELGFKANLINAVQAATMDLAEVCLVFGNRLVRGNQARRLSRPSLNVFESVFSEPLGKVDVGIKLARDRRQRVQQKTKLLPRIDEDIFVLEAFPGQQLEIIDRIVKLDPRGVIIKTFDTQYVMKNFIPNIKDSIAESTLLVIYSPHQVGEVANGKLRPLIISNMTWETTLMKFMWALGQTRDLGEIKRMMGTDLAGEIG